MEMNIRPLQEHERKYTYSQSQQLNGQTGCIGHLRGDFGSGSEFFTSWDDHRADLKTQDFKDELDSVINALRNNENYGGMLLSLSSMSKFCHGSPESGFDGSYTREYGFRVDTENYSYLFRLNPLKGDYNLYCYAYKREWLDRHIENASYGIRFISSDYKNKFTIADGDTVRITNADGNHSEMLCRYIDSHHLEFGSNIYHICELAERLEANGSKVIPLRKSLPEQCYSSLSSTNEVIIIKKGEIGYSKTDIPTDGICTAGDIALAYNQKIGVTGAQESAMKAGSMFGWEVPAANPDNYYESGVPKPVKGNRYDALSQSFESMELFGHQVMFFDGRIDRSTVPKGMYLYEIRHSDEDWGEPIELARGVMVNHFGTVISSKPIDIPPDGSREITGEDWGFTDEGISNLADYAKAYPPVDSPAPQKPTRNGGEAR